jgi:hypothetical protein
MVPRLVDNGGWFWKSQQAYEVIHYTFELWEARDSRSDPVVEEVLWVCTKVRSRVFVASMILADAARIVAIYFRGMSP